MSTATASDARANLYRLIDEASVSHEPGGFTGKRHNAILFPEEDCESIQGRGVPAVPGGRATEVAAHRGPEPEIAVDRAW